jgi:hypothetical protein
MTMPVNIFLPQVTRIPIIGPAPYNTLVCVSVETFQGSGEVRDGVFSRISLRVATPFRLAGFDQRIPPIFDHSTTAWINSTGPIKDGNWAYAVDSVAGAGFTPTDGTYFIDLTTATSVDGAADGTCGAWGPVTVCFYTMRIQVTSWVLCYEPPIMPPQGHIHRLNDLVQRGISSADLIRISTESTGRTAAVDHFRQVIRQFDIPISLSVPMVKKCDQR